MKRNLYVYFLTNLFFGDFYNLTRLGVNDNMRLEVDVMEFFDDVISTYSFSCSCDDQGCQGSCHGCDD